MTAQILTLPSPAAPSKLRALAKLLSDPAVFDVVFNLIADARDDAPRVRDVDGEPIDADSGDVLEYVIAALPIEAEGQS